MKGIIALVCLLSVGGCATVASSGPRTVTITGFGTYAMAQERAEAECRKYDLPHARLAGSLPSTLVYDCVN